MKQGFSFWCFEKFFTPQDLFQATVRLGFTAVDLLPQTLFSSAKQAGLEIAAINGHSSITLGLNDHTQHQRIEQEILANLKRAQTFGIKNLICFSGNRNNLPFETGTSIVAEGLGRVCQHAEDAGVNLILEMLNSKIDHPDYQADSSAFGLRVESLVGSSRVKLLYDVYHMQIMEGDLLNTINKHHSSFAHYHTAGNPGRHELDQNQEIQYSAVAAAIAQTGFSGIVSHEFIPRGDPLRALEQAFRVFSLVQNRQMSTICRAKRVR